MYPLTGILYPVMFRIHGKIISATLLSQQSGAYFFFEFTKNNSKKIELKFLSNQS